MSVQKVFLTFCFLSMHIFVYVYAQPIPIVSGKLIRKHILQLENDMEIDDIPLSYIRKHFDEMQIDRRNNFIENRDRKIHTYIVTSNLLDLKDNVRTAFIAANKIEERIGGNDYYKETVAIDFGQLPHKKGVINFKIIFNKKEEKYIVVGNTCAYSNTGTLILGAINTRGTDYRDVINHLTEVKLNDPKKCRIRPLPEKLAESLPPGTCGG